MSTKIRSFIAVRFDSDLICALARLQDKLRVQLPSQDIRWVRPANLHLTLQFLGDLEQGLLPKLSGSLRDTYSDQAPFTLDLRGVGAYPRPSQARVIWAGLQHGALQLKGLYARTIRVTQTLGYEAEDRPYRAHATLARIKTNNRRPPNLNAALQPFSQVSIGTCQIDQVVLFKSRLTSQGPIYEQLDSFNIGS